MTLYQIKDRIRHPLMHLEAFLMRTLWRSFERRKDPNVKSISYRSGNIEVKVGVLPMP